MKEIDDVEEVVIRTGTRELYLNKPQVIEMKGKDSTIFQIVAASVEEVERESPSIKEEDIALVMQQAAVSREKALTALSECQGDIAQAILNLTA